MLAGTILCENKDTKEVGATGRKLGGGGKRVGRPPWNTGPRKFPAIITKANGEGKQLEKKKKIRTKTGEKGRKGNVLSKE